MKEIVAETLHDLIDPIIYDEAASLIEEHHTAGRDVVIVSTSGAEVVEPIGELLGADRVVATRMVVGEDGCFTGRGGVLRLRADQGRGDQGARRVRGVRPGALLRLQRLGHRRPDAGVGRPPVRRQPGPRAAPGGGRARVADSRLQPPGPAQAAAARFSMPPRPALVAAAAVGAAAATAGLVWYASRRRRRPPDRARPRTVYRFVPI